MDLSLTEAQEMLKNSAREYVRQEYPKEILLDLDKAEINYTSELRAMAAEIGWLGIVIPDEYGGEGSCLTDAAVIFQELGRGPVPGPYLSSSVLGAMIVLQGGRESQKREILPAIAQGKHTVVLAFTEADYGWGPGQVRMRATRRNESYVLDGIKLYVNDASNATQFICAARTSETDDPARGISLLLVDAQAPGISVRVLPGFLASSAEVKFDSVEVPDSALLGEIPDGGWQVLQGAVERAIPILCSYNVGGCEAVFDMSVAYSQTRVQFGVPIGRFQRVQDHIVNLVNHLDAARWTTYEALWKLDTGRDATASVHLAKAVSSEAYYQACNYAHEVHAGVGIMKEYGLTLHTKSSRTLYHYLGDPRYHKLQLAEALQL